MSKQTDLINIPDAITVSGSNVGIGTSSASSLLTIHGSQPIITLSDSDTGSTSTISGNSGHLILNADSGSDASNNTIDFQIDNSQKMRIDSSGNVGIGTSSSSEKLHVSGTGDRNIAVESTSSGAGANAGIKILSADGGDFLLQTGNATGNALRLYDLNANSERLRIDSAGNLIVSGTASGQATSVALHNGGYVHAVTSHQMAGIFDRRDSDGDILIFRKDGSGTSVGSIGTGGGGINFNSQGSDFAIRRSGTDVLYVGATASYPGADNSKDLGVSSYRWKDAYLSGGIYLGGTGSANKLDDYEEGACTLTWSGTGGTANTTNTMSYVKVGSRVTISGNTTSALPNATGTLELTGLPFAANEDAAGAMLYRYMSPPSGVHNLVMYLGSGQTKLQPYWASGNNYTRLTSSHFATVNAQDIYFSITYQTNS